MRSTRRTALALAVALAGAATQIGAAQADSVSVTAAVDGGTLGTRTLTVLPTLALSGVAGGAAVSGTLQTVVTETSKQGVNPVKVTVAASNFSGQGPAAGSTITSDNLTIAAPGSTTVKVGGGTLGTPDAAGSTFAAERTVLTVAETTTNLYTGTYTTNTPLSLAIPNAVATGTYGATLTVTLVQ